MNVMTQVHPFLDGKPKRMLIDGKWLEAVSGKTFESHNPATGELLANVAEGDAEDVNLDSGIGREGGVEGLQCYTVVKNVSHLTA